MYQGDRNVFFLENFHARTKWLTTELINSNELFIFNARCIQRQLFALQLANHIFFQFFSHLWQSAMLTLSTQSSNHVLKHIEIFSETLSTIT